ncbi:RPM1-interacting protein 4 [Linum perenne]
MAQQQQRSHVPKFGNWESDDNVPYTAYFDKARKGRTGGKMINPNDPMENPDLLVEQTPSAPPKVRVESEEPPAGQVRRTHERRRSREDNEFKQQAVGSPNRRAGSERPGGGRGSGGGSGGGRPARHSAGSDNSFEKSPLHPHARVSGRGSGAPSPVWEGKSSQENSHSTPGRSRMRPKGDESPDQSSAVPKFGDWDENNPASADGYTHIFNKVREERLGGGAAGRSPGGSYGDSSARKHKSGKSSMSCCFPWGSK